MSESNLEDRAAIHDLFTRYCCALDNGEIEAVVDCFTVDAILKSPVIGRDESSRLLSLIPRLLGQACPGQAVGRVSGCYALSQPRRTQGSDASGALSLSDPQPTQEPTTGCGLTVPACPPPKFATASAGPR